LSTLFMRNNNEWMNEWMNDHFIIVRQLSFDTSFIWKKNEEGEDDFFLHSLKERRMWKKGLIVFFLYNELMQTILILFQL
jgi:hypothetical protein